jgi:hypothetical protein
MSRPKSAWLALAILAAGTTSPVNAQENTASYHAAFELPDYTVGSIHSQRGWSVEQGRAEVVAGAGRNASAGLVLEPLAPFSQATLLLDAPSAPTSAGFLDFHISPAATSEVKLEEMLDINGARIGFYRNPQDQSYGRFWVFNGDGMGGGVWQPTAVSLAVDAATGRPAEWIRLTMREDFVGGSWDLWVNGQLAASRAGFQEPIGNHIGSYVILGDTVERLVLDDLTIGGPNPLGMDQDRDGMLDVDEGRIGSNPEMADREELDAAGQSFGEKWQALLAAGDAAGTASLAPAPTFSRPSAVARESFSLTLSSSGSAAIFYTLDGSDPLPAHALTYTGPVEIRGTTVVRACATNAAGRTSKTTAAAWVFPEQVAAQARPATWPATLSEADPATGGLRLFALDPQLHPVPSPSETADPVAAALLVAPIVVLTADPDSLFGSAGVYQNAADPNGRKTGGEVVWMDGASGNSGGAGGVRISVSGERSRSHFVTLKHSLRVSWPTTAEAGPVFGQASFPCRQFLLRHPTQDSWVVDGAWSSRRAGARYISDAWASDWLASQNRPSLQHHWVHLFLNGTYWGVYDAVEQHDAGYSERHQLSGPVHLVEPDTANGAAGVRAISGSAEGWVQSLLGLKQAVAGRDTTDDTGWEAAAASFDTDGLIDYILWNWWLANVDWPSHNWLASSEFGKWKLLSWDAEMVLPLDGSELPSMAVRLEADRRGPGAAFVLLAEWPAFRSRVASRLAALTASDGALSPVEVQQAWDAAAARFRPLVAAESARWGAQYQLPLLTPADWEAAVARVSRKFLPDRAATLREEVTAFLSAVAARAAAQTHPDDEAGGIVGPIQAAPTVAVPVDSDGDRMPDDWELQYGLNPADSADALGDGDGDGILNIDEFLRRSSPLVADAPKVQVEDGPSVHTRFPLHQRRRVIPAVR